MLFTGETRPRGPPPSMSNTPVDPVSSLVRQDTRRTFFFSSGATRTQARNTPPPSFPRRKLSEDYGLGAKNTLLTLPSLRGTGRPSHNLVDAADPRGTWDSSGRRRGRAGGRGVSSGRRGADISRLTNACMCDRLANKCARRGRRRDGGRAGGRMCAVM